MVVMLFKLCHGSHFSFWVRWALCLHFPFCCTGSEEPGWSRSVRKVSRVCCPVSRCAGEAWPELGGVARSWLSSGCVERSYCDGQGIPSHGRRALHFCSFSDSGTVKNVSSILTHSRGLLHCQNIVGARIGPLGGFGFPAGRCLAGKR